MNAKAILVLAIALLPACTTTRSATSAELAHCRAMADAMGTERQHSHAEAKGTMASTPMNADHERCRAMLKKKN